MARKKQSQRVSLAKQYGLRENVIVKLPVQMNGKTYYATSTLKGGKSSYAGKIVTRNSKDGKIIRVVSIEKEKS